MRQANRDKTRVVDLLEQKASLDFLGYTVRWHRDQYGRNVEEGFAKRAGSDQELTDRRQGCTPIRLIDRLNRPVQGWANYFSLGYPSKAFRNINRRLSHRLANHLKPHRSQRPYRLPEGISYCEHFQQLGVEFLRCNPASAPD